MALDEVLRLLRALHDHGVEYVLVGGTALSLHGILRATEGVPVRLATPETLYRMKRGTLRDVDRGDAEALRRMFGLGD